MPDSRSTPPIPPDCEILIRETREGEVYARRCSRSSPPRKSRTLAWHRGFRGGWSKGFRSGLLAGLIFATCAWGFLWWALR
jgi:hypothetical protein